MKLCIGVDVGSISIKLAGIADKSLWNHIDNLISNNSAYKWTAQNISENQKMFVYDSVRVSGKPLENCKKLLTQIEKDFPSNSIEGISITGSGSKSLGSQLGFNYVTEFKAIAQTFKSLYPDVHSVFEIGGENSKYLGLMNGLINDYETNGDCAAGTGSFLDQQANRLMFKIEDVSDEALKAERAAIIAGRCSVFAKSDMIHSQQKGYTPGEILQGLCNAISLNYKSNLLRGKDISLPVAFIGGVALNAAVVKSLKQTFELNDNDLIIPQFPSYVAAFGAALIESQREHLSVAESINSKMLSKEVFPTFKPLDMNNVILLRNNVKEYDIASISDKIDIFMGVDIGSVSTNLVLVDAKGDVVKEIYVMTAGRPIQVVSDALLEIKKELGEKINIKGVGTTGSGRELVGELIGADVVKDEITAHKTGASFISRKYFNEDVETIFEIGGQDSKFISLNKGVVTDFHMNEACSAGTGSFLQEQAEKLGINIKGEFADLALKSQAPINLGERCTVFIEKDLNNYQQKGATISELVSGLAYSIVHNYLNRVVRGRKIGKIVYFQGGTAYNDAVAAAFSIVLNKKIIVPPHNGVMGAVGMALVAKEHFERTGIVTKFRGYDTSVINYSLKEFTCKACSNQCDIQEFNVEGNKTYWGDKCSDKYRKAVKTGLKPVIKDIFKERELLLFESFNKYHTNSSDNKKTVGFPRAMYFFDRLPFWSTFLGELGFKMILSDPTNKKISSVGVESVVAQPCYPIKVAHGHVLNLIEKKPDYILIPAMITSESKLQTEEEKKKAVGRKMSYFCPWGQTMADVIKSNFKFNEYKNKFLIPKVELREGHEFVINDFYNYFKSKFSGINKKNITEAYYKAVNDLDMFRNKLQTLYKEAIEQINKNKREAIVIIGRPYNVNDTGMNLNLTAKLRDFYGVNVLPIDSVVVPSEDIDDINSNMFWGYGTKILSTLKYFRNIPNIHVIYITNFQCGPDSYIKHFAPEALGKSYLTLQFDGHGNDAGMLTRCEAYLDSKGVFKIQKQKISTNIIGELQ